MPIINGIYTKDFPDLGRSVLGTDLVPIAVIGDNVTYKLTVTQLLSIASNYWTTNSDQTGLTGDKTTSGNFTISGGANVKRFIMDADNNVARIFSFRTGNLPRWAFRVDGNETGIINQGSDLSIRRYNDAGTFIDAPLSFSRSSGEATFSSIVTGNAGFQTSANTIIASTYSGTSSNNITLQNAGGQLTAGLDNNSGSLTGSVYGGYINIPTTRDFYIQASSTKYLKITNTTGGITLSSLTNGLVKSTSGLLSNAVAGTDYQVPITLSTIGSSPNTNGATLSSGTLTLQPASASFGGVVTTGTQTFAGVKTFANITIQTGLNGRLITSESGIQRQNLATTADTLYLNQLGGSIAFGDKMYYDAVNKQLVVGDNPTFGLFNSATGDFVARGVVGSGYIPKYRTQGFGAQGYFVADRANGSIGSPTALNANDLVASFLMTGYPGSGSTSFHASEMKYLANQNWTPSAMGSRIEWWTIHDNDMTQTKDLDLTNGVLTGTFSGGLTGNASTATALQTARNINGVSFNGTADITVAAAASTLTGTTLASGVTASSLTSAGTTLTAGNARMGTSPFNSAFSTFGHSSFGVSALSGFVQQNNEYAYILSPLTTFSGGSVVMTNLTASQLVATDADKNLVSVAYGSGTYTPTLTNGTNVTSSIVTLAHYNRIGNEVTVYGTAQITPTSGSASTSFAISLPISSNFTAAEDLRGNPGILNELSARSASLEADFTNDRAKVDFSALTGSDVRFDFSFMYTVK